MGSRSPTMEQESVLSGRGCKVSLPVLLDRKPPGEQDMPCMYSEKAHLSQRTSHDRSNGWRDCPFMHPGTHSHTSICIYKYTYTWIHMKEYMYTWKHVHVGKQLVWWDVPQRSQNASLRALMPPLEGPMLLRASLGPLPRLLRIIYICIYTHTYIYIYISLLISAPHG